MPLDVLLEILVDLAGEAPEIIGDMAGELGQDVVDAIADLGLDAGDLGLLDELVNADLASIALEAGADGIDPHVFSGYDPDALTYAGVDFGVPFDGYEQVVVEPDVDSGVSKVDAGYSTRDVFVEDPLTLEGYENGDLSYDPGSAEHISTTGFEASGWGSAYYASEELASSVPAEHLAELGSVSYSPEPLYDQESGGYIRGVYNSDSGSITIVNADPEANIGTFRHEVGHHLWNRNPDLHADYMQARLQDAAIGGGPAVNTDTSLYPKSELVEESFCNDYADILRDPDRFRWKNPEVASVLERIVASGSIVESPSV